MNNLDHKTLQATREAAGLTRAQLAGKSGVDVTTIFRIETCDQTPRLDVWRRLMDALMEAKL